MSSWCDCASRTTEETSVQSRKRPNNGSKRIASPHLLQMQVIPAHIDRNRLFPTAAPNPRSSQPTESGLPSTPDRLSLNGPQIRGGENARKSTKICCSVYLIAIVSRLVMLSSAGWAGIIAITALLFHPRGDGADMSPRVHGYRLAYTQQLAYYAVVSRDQGQESKIKIGILPVNGAEPPYPMGLRGASKPPATLRFSPLTQQTIPGLANGWPAGHTVRNESLGAS